MNVTQTDTKVGQLPLICGEDLTGKEGLLGKLTTTGVLLPTAITDITPYIVVGGEVITVEGQFKPLTNNENARVFAKGAGSKGASLVLANPATPADKGKVRALPVASGTYRVLAIAEEDFVDGQLVKLRPCSVGNIVVA